MDVTRHGAHVCAFGGTYTFGVAVCLFSRWRTAVSGSADCTIRYGTFSTGALLQVMMVTVALFGQSSTQQMASTLPQLQKMKL